MNLYLFTFLAVVNTFAWYVFFYYSLYSIKIESNLKRAAALLLVLFSLALFTCPFILSFISMMLPHEMMTMMKSMPMMQMM